MKNKLSEISNQTKRMEYAANKKNWLDAIDSYVADDIYTQHLQVKELKDTPFIKIEIWVYNQYTDTFGWQHVCYKKINDDKHVLSTNCDDRDIWDYLKKKATELRASNDTAND